MHTLQHAFRVHLRRQRGLSEWSAVRYVTVAGVLLTFCEERGYALERGEVPASVLVDFAASCDDGRTWRGAVLFCEFLRERGVELPELDPLPGALSVVQVEAFLGAAEAQPEPYATLLCLLPWSGLRAQDLLRLPRAAVHESASGALSLVHEGARVGLGSRAQDQLRGYLRDHAPPLGEGDLLFGGKSGGSIAPSTITRRLQQCRLAAGLPEFRATALSDVYQTHFFEPASPPSAAGGGLDGVVDDEGGSEAHRPEPDEPRAIAPPSADPPANEPPELSHEPTAEEPSEDPSMTYDDDPFDELDEEAYDDEPDDEPSETQDVEPGRGSGSPGSRRRDGRRRARRPDARGRERTGSARRASARDVDGLLPKSGYIHIRRRDPERGGRPRYCGRYLVREVAPDGSIEAFIFEKLAPTWGGGEYLIFTNAHDLRPRAVVDVETPPSPPSARGAGGSPWPGEPERPAESVFEAGFRLGRREAARDPYPYPPYGYGYDAPPPLPLGGASLPLPETSGPPDWFLEERRMQFDREKEERKAQLEREEREERRREAERKAQLEREEREFVRRQAELDRREAAIERREERMEERRKEAGTAAAAAADPFEAAGSMLDKVLGLTAKVQKVTAGNDNGGKDRGPVFELLETAVGNLSNQAGSAFSEVMSRGVAKRGPKPAPRSAHALAGSPPRRPSKKAKKANRARAGADRSPAPATAPEPTGPPEQAPVDPRRELPEHVPGYVRGPAEKLEQAIAEGQAESAILERLIGMLAALAAAPRWTPFVQAVLMHLVRDEMEQTLRGLGAILGAVVRAEVIEEPTAHRVLNIAHERWEEAREAILVAYQQRQAGAAE